MSAEPSARFSLVEDKCQPLIGWKQLSRRLLVGANKRQLNSHWMKTNVSLFFIGIVSSILIGWRQMSAYFSSRNFHQVL